MAIVVLTKDHGEIPHKEAVSASHSDDGFLEIETHSGDSIALYAPGTWVSATKVELTKEVVKAKPRAWYCWTSVPEGVVVTDKCGGTYRRGQGGSWEVLLDYDFDLSEWEESSVPVGDRNLYAPFTEVIA
ncbi:hypothetical protein SEA_SCHATZIE_138 [Mycobacterium phage Schatzie]|nr:hypothetical protein [Acinetobacter baumannii]ATN88950.1 hypothetical protein SEA_DMPSTRDIVER_143 [Mycobacterium phage DmpstrDiver]QCO93827.1 hypothetical protein SEA_SCHATZIE_138 [Mycobacterium phage Schatzie]